MKVKNKIVVDCSFVLSTILPDEEGDLFEIAACEIYVPSIFYLECLNVLMMAKKRRRITEREYTEYAQMISQFLFYVDHYSSTPQSLMTIKSICQNYELTSYDASYVELALRLNATLCTKDKKLAQIFEEKKISVENF